MHRSNFQNAAGTIKSMAAKKFLPCTLLHRYLWYAVYLVMRHALWTTLYAPVYQEYTRGCLPAFQAMLDLTYHGLAVSHCLSNQHTLTGLHAPAVIGSTSFTLFQDSSCYSIINSRYDISVIIDHHVNSEGAYDRLILCWRNCLQIKKKKNKGG